MEQSQLEPHFVEMLKGNRSLLQKRTGKSNGWEVIQGDARELSSLLKKGCVGVISPPYQNSQINPGNVGNEIVKRQAIEGSATDHKKDGYSSNPSNIGNLPDKELVGIVSPHYSEADDRISKGKVQGGYVADCLTRTYERSIHSSNPSNIGNQKGETYLEAMRKVYQEAYLSGISPLATVTKNPTRNGELRRLDLDTANLLMQVGYEIVDYHRAILFEERKQQTLTGDVEMKPKGRLSFFKRLSYQKGNVVAQWEDVIIATRQA